MMIERYEGNPIIAPNKDRSWEAAATFNGCPIEHDGKTFLLYRALSLPHYHAAADTRLMVSDIGIAESDDGLNFHSRSKFILPELEWERFGCEDPRIAKLDGTYYTFYTALGSWPPHADTIRVGVALSDNLKTVKEKHLVTPFNAKAMALFPEKIGKKIWAILAVNTDQPPASICVVPFNKPEDMWSEDYWNQWYAQKDQYAISLQRRPQDHVEVGAPPVATEHGWLLLYSYIRNYFSDNKLFGIEAVLLDKKDPRIVIARTDYPLLVPEEYYERYGMVPNIVFPSGVLIGKDVVQLYYGAADTTCCVASISFSSLMARMLGETKKTAQLVRASKRPVIMPVAENDWEAQATFNPAAVYLDGKVHIVYRAMSQDNTSVFGYATSSDGITIDYRDAEPIYVPREPFEQKLVPGGNSGAEDPRLVCIDETVYMFYTAFDGAHPPRVALTSITKDDFVNQRWNWSTPVLISPPDLDDKDAAMFPEKINGKYFIIHRNGEDIDLSPHKTLEFDGKGWLEEQRWIRPRAGWWDSRKIGIASPPIKTEHGWLVLYHGVSDEDGVYRVGAVLADLADPFHIIGRSNHPIFEPETVYEKEGIVANVVFPCGAVVIKEKLFVYYGGADKVINVAKISLKSLLATLLPPQ